MNSAELLTEAFSRIRGIVARTVDGLSAEQLAVRPDGEGNSIAWLIWHLTRIQDDHVAEVAGRPQAYRDAGWADRFGLPFAIGATGYGFSSADVDATRITDPDLLVGYHAEVHRRTAEFLSGLSGSDLDRIVDERWDPPVTLGVRLVSVVSDDLQHAGQAAFLRGILDRR